MTTWQDDLTALGQFHNQFAGSVTWALRLKGIGIDRDAPVGTPGQPATVRRVWGWFAPLIRASATKYDVPVELIVMAICSESASGQTELLKVIHARREEPGYTSDDATPSRVSVGCMQTLLSTAREALKNPGLTTADLLDPAVSIEAGTAYMASQLLHTKYDPPLVAAAYNAGGVYIDVSRPNRWKLRCYPLGTGEYVDNAVKWFNDAMVVAQEPAGLPVTQTPGPTVDLNNKWAMGAPSFGIALDPATLRAPVVAAVAPSPKAQAAMAAPSVSTPVSSRPAPPTAAEIAEPGGPGTEKKA